MTQKSFFWNGASLGDADTWTPAGGYHMANEDYESPWVDIMGRALWNGDGNRGVLANWLNELAVTGVATPVAVDTGAAIVYGLYYENDASLNVAVPSPSSDTRYDMIVVRRDWAAQTARITRIAGVEGSGIPAMIQSAAPDGTGIWDIPLASLQVTTGGVITVTDAREFVTFTIYPQDDAFATAHLTNESIDNNARATRTKWKFLGGGNMQPSGNGFSAQFSYSAIARLLGGSARFVWQSAAVSEEGWTSVSTADPMAQWSFKVPDDWVSGDIDIYLWWMFDGSGLGQVNSAWQHYSPGGTVTYSGDYETAVCSTAVVNGTVGRDQLMSVTNLTGGEIILYAIEADSSATASLILGLELNYTGYL